MIYITGDTHGSFTRFNNKKCPAKQGDYIIICGDFGGVWDISRRGQHNLNWLSEKPYTILFCDGNHENFDMLNEYPVLDWNGGKVHKIRNNIYHLMRGEIFEIEGKSFFTFGGARSHDISDGILEPMDPYFKYKQAMLDKANGMYRINHYSWWAEEMPSKEEKAHGLQTLAEHNNKVDYIITHEVPIQLLPSLGDGSFVGDELNDYLGEILNTCDFKHWYFGHYHSDESHQYEGKQITLMYEKFIQI